MSSSRRLVLAAVVLIAAVCAALPFQSHRTQQHSRRDERSQLRWRESHANLPAPLRAQDMDLLASNRNTTVESQAPADRNETTNSVSHVATIRNESPPPRISSAYQPLLRPDSSTSEGKQASVTESFPRTTPQSSAVPANDGNAKPNSKVIRHRIRDGDSLQALAARYLGDPNRHHEIYEKNKHLLPSDEVLPLNLLIEIYVPR